jgi:hypothetical protein
MDAIAEFGIAQLPTPLTPQKVWKEIQDAKAAGLRIPVVPASAARPTWHRPFQICRSKRLSSLT